MKLETLTLKGVGPFTEEARLDLRELPPGLVAIVGENGAGKTMFLEAAIAVLDRAFISRGEHVPLTDYCGDDRGAFIDATYLFEGRGQYRARLNMDGLKGGSEAVLEHVDAGGRRRALNDGKVSTFDVARAQIFPSRDVLLASAFAAQNRRGSFVTLGKGERKDLFAALLGLEKYGLYAETARKAVALLDVKRAELRTLVDRLDAESNDAVTEEIAAEANQLQAEILTAEDRAQQLAGEIAALERQLLDARAKAQAYAEAVAALARLQEARREQERARDEAIAADRGARSAFETTKGMVVRERERRIAAATKAIAALVTIEALEAQLATAIARIDEQLAADQSDRDERLQNNRTNLIDQKDVIDAFVRDHERFSEQRDVERAYRADDVAAVGAAERALDDAHTAVRRHPASRLKLEVARRGAAVLADVPCGGKDAFAGCQFLADARMAKENMPALEQDVQALDAAEALVQQREQALTTARGLVTAFDARIADLDAKLAAIQRDATAGTPFKSLDERAAALKHAETRVKELQQEVEQLALRADGARHQARLDHEQRVSDRATRLADFEKEIAAATQFETSEIAGLERMRDAAIAESTTARTEAEEQIAAMAADISAAERAVADTRVDQTALADSEQRLALARADHVQTQATLARLQERGRALEQRRASVLAKREEAMRLRIALGRVDTDAVEWEGLVRACGKDGLPVLEIDAAGPTVSALTNDLLQSCFGSRFTVELVTQQAKASGKGLKEVFELKVWDAERPGDKDRDVSDLSGGEQVLIDEALKSAIAIFVNTRNEAPIRTCWRDETTGALDPENATRYMQMLRRVHERGGFAHVLFISHNADAAAMANVQIRVAAGAIAIEHAPFRNAA